MNGAPTWVTWLQATAFATWMRQALWAYPAAEVAHLAGVAVLVGSAVALDLRLVGLSPGLPVRALARHLLPWAWRGFALTAGTGVAMFAAHAADWWRSPAFPAKMALIALGGLNVWVFHRGVYRSVEAWDVGPPPLAARLAGAVSLGVWLGAVACGRLLAYL